MVLSRNRDRIPLEFAFSLSDSCERIRGRTHPRVMFLPLTKLFGAQIRYLTKPIGAQIRYLTELFGPESVSNKTVLDPQFGIKQNSSGLRIGI